MKKYKVGDMLTWMYNGDIRCDKILTVDDSTYNNGMTCAVDFNGGFYWVEDKNIIDSTSSSEFKVGDVVMWRRDKCEILAVVNINKNPRYGEMYGVQDVDTKAMYWAAEEELEPLKQPYKFNVGDRVIFRPPYIPTKSIVVNRRKDNGESKYLLFYRNNDTLSHVWWDDYDLILDNSTQ